MQCPKKYCPRMLVNFQEILKKQLRRTGNCQSIMSTGSMEVVITILCKQIDNPSEPGDCCWRYKHILDTSLCMYRNALYKYVLLLIHGFTSCTFSNEKTFFQYFLKFLKRSLQNFLKILNKICFCYGKYNSLRIMNE